MKKFSQELKISLCFISITLISAVSFKFELLNSLFFGLVVLATIFVSIKKDFTYGLLILLAELFIGSKGHLFWWTIAYDVPWGRVSIRLALFAVVILAWVLHLIIKRRMPQLIKHKSFRLIGLFILMLVLAVVNGFWIKDYSFGKVFSDANNWIYFLLIFPIADAAYLHKDFFKKVYIIAKAAVGFLIAKAVFFFAAFALAVPGLNTWLYHFERQTGGGQMAPAADGMWRIYFWSEMFLLPVAFILLGQLYLKIRDKKSAGKTTLFLGLVIAGIVLTLFRSFWAGGLVGLFVWLVVLVFTKKTGSFDVYPFYKTITVLLALVLISVHGIQYVGQGMSRLAGSRPDVQKELFSGSEPGIQNRINQFKPLVEKIKENPILGSGFGTEITYESIDPRTKGLVKTSALELGWLDMIMEFGLLGFLIFVSLLFYVAIVLFRALLKDKEKAVLYLSLIAGLVTIVATHTVSPFLNHPLGLGFLALLFVYVSNIDNSTKIA